MGIKGRHTQQRDARDGQPAALYVASTRSLGAGVAGRVTLSR